MSVSIQDFLRLRKEKVIVDVRSEGEFSAGHIRGAVNIPILNDAERIIVGTTYKTQGQQIAIEEGFRLVGPRLYDMVRETEKISNGKEILVYCWRGGMRSNNFCQFVGMAGIRTQALVGGYKSYRQKAHESFQQPFQLILISGCTGSGKSDVLRELKKQGEQVLDLEALANHKGSAFGGLMMPSQPTTEQFENELFEEILALDLTKRIWVEDESIAIGKIFLPHRLWQQMSKSQMVTVEVEKRVRIKRLASEYGQADQEEFVKAMTQIKTKLGGQHLNAAKAKYLEGDMDSTIDILLTYYDKAYLAGIERRKARVQRVFSWNGLDVSMIAKDLITNSGTH